tara:strand:- start:720 stop:1049 length:330 start_codon:yes stop_codon:yes gene_type:complete
MADAIKVLGQLAPSATTTEILYTVPNLAQTTVSSLVVCNRNAGNQTFRVSIHVDGAGADNKQYLYYDKQVLANDSVTVVIGITLNQADVVKVYASNADLSFNIFGVETT